MPADLIVYALVAAGLVFWLRNILGTREGDEPQRPNPVVNQVDAKPETMNETPFMSENSAKSSEDLIMDLAANPTSVLSVDNKTAENGLLEISKADKDFDINFFLDGAQEAFAIIVESFAKGEREMLKGLLHESVYNAFEGVISEREKAQEVQESEIHKIRKVQVLEAKLDQDIAFITVRFTADETSVRRDNTGEIIEGNPDKTSEMIDIWTFGRDIKGKSLAWFVYETRGGFDDDNDLIPDTH